MASSRTELLDAQQRPGEAQRLLSAYTPPVVPGVPAPATLFGYNVDRQLTQTTRPDGLLVGRTYDAAGKLDLLTTPTGNVDYDYFGLTPCPTCAPGRLQKITDPSGVVLEHAYDGPLLKTLTWSGASRRQRGLRPRRELPRHQRDGHGRAPRCRRSLSGTTTTTS
jgi:hypothetical protein